MRVYSIEKIKKVLKYENGKLFWTHFHTVRRKGKRAGTIHNGYRRIHFDKTIIMEHRIVWAIFNDCWPKGDLDHINGIRDDNRIENLREVTRSQNCQNTKRHRKGLPIGVGWSKAQKKWRARVPKNYLGFKSKILQKHIGYFDTKEEAEKALIEFCKSGGKPKCSQE